MLWFTALFLTVVNVVAPWSSAQETIQDWSKKVVELQEKEGQNFEQDLQLAKGFLYLQRRQEALALLNRLMTKGSHQKDARLNDLYETASTQFFFQDTAELYSEVVQLIEEESWGEAKEKTETALQKESRHRLLTLREIQLGLVLGQVDRISETVRIADSLFSESSELKVYDAWINLNKNDAKEAFRILSSLMLTDKKIFEKSEVPSLAYFQSSELNKHGVDWSLFSKIVQNHPEWVGMRVWRLKNKSFTPMDRAKEVQQLKDLFSDLKKLKDWRGKQEKESTYFYSGIVSLEKTKASFDEWIVEEDAKNSAQKSAHEPAKDQNK